MTVSNSPSDAELLRRMSAGDEEAFVELYRRRQAGVYRFAMQMCGSQTIAEDVTQEVFMVLMRDGEKYDATRGSLAAYLYGIARNHVLRALERDRAFVPLVAETTDAEVQTMPEKLIEHPDLIDALSRHQTIERVRQAVLALPAHYREAVVLCDLHEMSYAEAASALDCAVGTVRSRLHRARAMLIEKLRGAAAGEATGGETKVTGAEGELKQPATEAIKTVRCFA